MCGESYSFCEDCLRNLTAWDFWDNIFQKWEMEFPPTLCEKAQAVFDRGGDPGEYHRPNQKEKLPKISVNDEKRVRESERKKMSNGLRYDILRRDNFRCVLCGESGENVQLEVDHIHPVSKGGKTTEENLRTLCFNCNRGKHAKIE